MKKGYVENVVAKGRQRLSSMDFFFKFSLAHVTSNVLIKINLVFSSS